MPPEQQLAHAAAVAEAIGNAAGSEPFVIWLTAPGESDGAYRFQLERRGTPPAGDEMPLPAHLFVICQATICHWDQLREAAGPEWSNCRLVWQTHVFDDDLRLVTAGLTPLD